MRIQLLGAPAIIADGHRLEHPSKKAMALLAYLAMRADDHISRNHLASLLWADSGEEQARANLRQTLSQLRKLFLSAGADPIMVPFDKVVLSSEAVEIDVKSLLSAISTATASSSCPACRFSSKVWWSRRRSSRRGHQPSAGRSSSALPLTCNRVPRQPGPRAAMGKQPRHCPWRSASIRCRRNFIVA